MLCELADATIGTAHSTAIAEGETFASIDLRISFFRPVWRSVLTATARQVQHGKTLTHYECEIIRDDGKPVALATSTVMTLRGMLRTDGDVLYARDASPASRASEPCNEKRGPSELKKIMIMTGGSRGIGAATAQLVAARGHAMWVNYRADRLQAEIIRNS